MSSENREWSAINSVSRLHTITFRYPREFLKAVASSLGRVGDTATTMEAEEFIREAVKANIECLLEEHLGRSSTLKARVSRGGTERKSTFPSKGNGRMKARLRRT